MLVVLDLHMLCLPGWPDLLPLVIDNVQATVDERLLATACLAGLAAGMPRWSRPVGAVGGGGGR